MMRRTLLLTWAVIVAGCLPRPLLRAPTGCGGGTIDRFEGSYAVVLGANGAEHGVPRSAWPRDALEGDVLSGGRISGRCTSQLQREIAIRLERLRRSPDSNGR